MKLATLPGSLRHMCRDYDQEPHGRSSSAVRANKSRSGHPRVGSGELPVQVRRMVPTATRTHRFVRDPVPKLNWKYELEIIWLSYLQSVKRKKIWRICDPE